MYLLYGKLDALKYIPQDFKVFNFSCLKEIGIPMNLLPPNNLGAIDEYDFDCRYANYLMMYDAVFFNMMNFIITLYANENVFILIDSQEDSFFSYGSSWSAILIESFLKFVQQRYGLNATLVNNEEDINSAENISFSDYGIYNLDGDKERYSYLLEYSRIASGGKPYGTDQ